MVKELLRTCINTGRAIIMLFRVCAKRSPITGVTLRESGASSTPRRRHSSRPLGVLDRLVKPGDHSEKVASPSHNLVIASAAKQIQSASAERFWIASLRSQ
ncbi:hypothetical protein IVA87_06030 [Bradyrhizobium sp. 147]|uniref:hypothetical protein n=1 Tax=unclassified Bradyrhizobium TaxID=2631580 RepID=UPI001FF7917B|nr:MULTISPECIES: hypothetical protein [unclassified Bradyrhizobium]MCK1625650.1 hypothetical protein [Bradyrhizobium sp. 160]MCK1679040.1 hypothetical protein [Bradyrhizobium sp. 147]